MGLAMGMQGSEKARVILKSHQICVVRSGKHCEFMRVYLIMIAAELVIKCLI